MTESPDPGLRFDFDAPSLRHFKITAAGLEREGVRRLFDSTLDELRAGGPEWNARGGRDGAVVIRRTTRPLGQPVEGTGTTDDGTPVFTLSA